MECSRNDSDYSDGGGETPGQFATPGGPCKHNAVGSVEYQS